jgi:hypothetical protein
LRHAHTPIFVDGPPCRAEVILRQWSNPKLWLRRFASFSGRFAWGVRAGANYSFLLNENGSLRRELFQEIANKTAKEVELVACHRQRLCTGLKAQRHRSDPASGYLRPLAVVEILESKHRECAGTSSRARPATAA